jgi:hypothetical protein
MKTISLITLALIGLIPFGAPADCKNVKTTYTVEKSLEIQQSQPGWANLPPPARVVTEKVTYQSKKAYDAAMSRSSKRALPATPMGATIGTPGDYIYQKRPGGTTKQVREGNGLSGLPNTRMGAAVGMPGDRVNRQKSAASSYNSLGLPGTRFGATVDKPGDAMRSDLRNNGYKRFPSKRPVVTKPVDNQATHQSNYPATYGSYDGKPKRNY